MTTSARRHDHPKPHIWLAHGIYYYRAAGLTAMGLTADEAWRLWKRRAAQAMPKFIPTPRRWLELGMSDARPQRWHPKGR